MKLGHLEACIAGLGLLQGEDKMKEFTLTSYEILYELLEGYRFENWRVYFKVQKSPNNSPSILCSNTLFIELF